MACSRFEYVKKFEEDDRLLPGCWAVVRLDGRGFTKLSKVQAFTKPNDENALRLMNAAAAVVMHKFSEIVLAYGQSDEYSFVFRRETALFNRRKRLCRASSHSSRQHTLCIGLATSAIRRFRHQYVLIHVPATAALFADSLCSLPLMRASGVSTFEAERRLKGTFSNDKNEILFTEFGINYNNENPMFRKGSTIIRNIEAKPNGNSATVQTNGKLREESTVQQGDA
eukprot:IDg9732t1